ncbi:MULTISPECIES: thermonuclease family protein [unclassified Campylobacter]|uniref:thermonuclease family protein n=1 Tax=unclassified Campylobacter TaxID=2593542 RepID=UPI0012381D5E|nr:MULTISPECIES: thermonuclease family protein [unclassified Campylobacter]KAA6224700.1 thermonuclease family protein [Campylobacter sp. LR185c]KAA6225698.1 thermonuclease family protein [Campylobacter sp. LR286c]KAA6225818.1 thermonuclease family protein [Campylobacter sp. LR196d]KAA6229671.1 thermonuclease family protein [Campylobacter sp. LR291e]KAA6230083.1 thermonuclease family protein [Campylobacter sp. LR264d]
MRITRKNILNLRRLLSNPKQLFILLIISLALFLMQEFSQEGEHFSAQVLRVIDGDTIEISYQNEKSKIRFFGIDAPELKQEFGEESKLFLSSLIDKKQVEVFKKDKDKYNRILAIIKLNNEDINKKMVRFGYAHAYIYYSDIYKDDEKIAKENKLGLWADKNPVSPYEWRKKNNLIKKN